MIDWIFISGLIKENPIQCKGFSLFEFFIIFNKQLLKYGKRTSDGQGTNNGRKKNKSARIRARIIFLILAALYRRQKSSSCQSLSFHSLSLKTQNGVR